MSALGQKQTYALQQAMSALHPIATAKADIYDSSSRSSGFPHRSGSIRRSLARSTGSREWTAKCTSRDRVPTRFSHALKIIFLTRKTYRDAYIPQATIEKTTSRQRLMMGSRLYPRKRT